MCTITFLILSSKSTTLELRGLRQSLPLVMEAVARASVAGSSHVRLPQRWGLRQRHAVPSSAACRPRGRAVACAASADADVVHLFDAAKLTVIRELGSPVLCRGAAHPFDSFHGNFISSAEALVFCDIQVDEFVTSGMVVGLGSGAASGLAVQYLGTRLRRGSLTGIIGVPS
jgi:ribose 5-phosphate isomerase A